jgi:O-antigen/teichoic acid export membrane protein
MALAVDFAAHVLVVRYLLKEEFGVYSYALAIVLLLSTAVQLGLPETLARYVPIYRERGQRGRMVGAVIVSVGAVAVAGAACVLFVLGLPEVTASLLGSAGATAVLAVLIFYVPLEGVNLVLQALFASFGRVRLIFLRQYVLVPGLRFAVVLVLVTQGYGAMFLAAGYVLVSAAGLLLYTAGAGAGLGHPRRALGSGVELPAREIFSFALPVFLGILLILALFGVGTVALGLLKGPEEVAAFEAVLPPARLNQLVPSVFAVLYLPTASRLFARGLTSDLRNVYTATTLWMIVLGLPGLALTTVFAPVFVPTVFGERYSSSSSVLILLAAAYFFSSLMGPSNNTLKVLGRLRYTVTVDSFAFAFGSVLIVGLVSAAGAVGAALGTLMTIAVRDLALQMVVRRSLGGGVLGGDYIRLIGGTLLVLAILTAIQLAFEPGLIVAVLLSGAAGIAMLVSARRMLDVEGLFPELGRALPRFLRP